MRALVLVAAIPFTAGIATESMASDVYKVTVTRDSADLYKVQSGNVYIKTRYCYEYVYGDEAILRIDSTAGYNIGKIIFSSGTSCDVAKLLKG